MSSFRYVGSTTSFNALVVTASFLEEWCLGRNGLLVGSVPLYSIIARSISVLIIPISCSFGCSSLSSSFSLCVSVPVFSSTVSVVGWLPSEKFSSSISSISISSLFVSCCCIVALFRCNSRVTSSLIFSITASGKYLFCIIALSCPATFCSVNIRLGYFSLNIRCSFFLNPGLLCSNSVTM
uniref:Uncharacterized protein n=1 Tax=Cacopsylla melanoneura TaxID=428564 RepID=A0A8D9E895_9HEMI